MIIIPAKVSNNDNRELLPIEMVLENRMDMMIVLLRVLRYLGSVGAWGPNLIWEDSKDSPIGIYKFGENHYGDVNKLPRMVVSIGGYRLPDSRYLYGDATDTSQRGTDRNSDMNIGMNIQILGRSDTETYRLTDSTADYLKALRPSIIASVVNLEDIAGITVGSVNPSRDNSGNPYMWESSISLGTYAYKFYNTSMYKGLGRSPDPNANQGLTVGAAGPHSLKTPHPDRRPLFLLGDFVTIAGDPKEPGGEFTVSNSLVFNETDTESYDKFRVAEQEFTSSVASIEEEAPAEFNIALTKNTPGATEIEITLPDFIGVNLPGFNVVHPSKTLKTNIGV